MLIKLIIFIHLLKMVNTQLQLARFRHRILAILSESILIELIAISISLAIIALLKLTDIYLILGILFVLYLVIIVFLDFINYVLIAKLTKGKTFGKALFNIRILQFDGSFPNFSNLYKHWFLALLISFILSWAGIFVNFLVMIKDPYRQGIHNSFAGTIVVKSKTSTKKRILLWIITLIILILTLAVITFSSINILENVN